MLRIPPPSYPFRVATTPRWFPIPATSADRSAGINHQRHRFVLSGVWNLNYAQRFSGAAKQILGGWELSGILTAQSGQPYSAMVNTDLNNDSNRSTDRTPGLGRDTFYLPRSVSLD